MQNAFRILLSLVVALGVGAWTARSAIQKWPDLASDRYGPWHILATLGQPGGDPYAKALLQIEPRMVIGMSEGARYVAATTDDGKPLSPLCSYRLRGDVPLARLFTLHAEDMRGNLLLPPAPLPGTLHSDGLMIDGKSYEILVSAQAKPGNWLAIRSFAPFRLVMHQYDVAVVSDQAIQRPRLPRIEETGCGNG